MSIISLKGGSVVLALLTLAQTPAQHAYLVLKSKGKEMHWSTDDPANCVTDVQVGPEIKLVIPVDAEGNLDRQHARIEEGMRATFRTKCGETYYEVRR